MAENDPATAGIDLVGGKGFRLSKLLESGVTRVPKWSIVDSTAFRRHSERSEIANVIKSALGGLRMDNIGEAAKNIAAAFMAAPLDDSAVAAIEAAYRHVGSGRVAVRSSGVEEDGAAFSFAGQHATYLNVPDLPAVLDRVRQCWASAYSSSALAYRLLHGLQADTRGLAVVIQTMVDSVKSGVLFTANPVSGSPAEMMISAVYGLGESLVSGAVDADTLVISRQGGATISANIGDKAERYVSDSDSGGWRAEAVEVADRQRLALEPGELMALREMGERIASAFGEPQDIEWAIDGDGTVWALQSRALTAIPKPSGELRIWDNSNIIESFGDLTAPLTFSFARHVYHEAYGEYARLLGVGRRQLQQMDDWLPNMLGYFNGRVYYNLLNWYKIIRLAPCYRANRTILELSMGVAEPLADDLALAQQPLVTHSAAQARLLRLIIAATFCWRFVSIGRSVRRFIKEFYNAFGRYDSAEYSDSSALDVYRAFQELEREILPKWGRMIILEAVIGLSYGALQVMNTRWLPEAPDWFRWAVARPVGDIESLAPAHQMAELAETAKDSEAISAILAAGQPGDAYERLATAGESEFLSRVDAYIRRFGYRSFNELKLEEPDMREKPSLFFEMLCGTMRGDQDTVGGQGRTAARSGDAGSADSYLRANLSWWKRLPYEMVRRKVRKSLGARENVRFCRSRAYGMVRRMVKAMGADLHRSGALRSADDIFYLRLEEIRACLEGTSVHAEIQSIVDNRRQLLEQFGDVPGPGRFRTYGIPYWNGNLEQAGWRSDPLTSGSDVRPDGVELRGVCGAPGVAEGQAEVVKAPANAGGKILVTYRTDPGWIAVLPSAAGLVIERGSPLTHVAIAAREFGIPTVVQIPGVTRMVASGDRLHVDGTAGVVRVVGTGLANGKVVEE